MRLINVHTLQLEEFFDTNIPRYAILSHTWGPDEITIQDFGSSSGCSSSCRQLRGYTKVTKACQAAFDKCFDYLWCDTCCIDKTSSAELSEAINSMFRWYSNSGCCLVYLEDFAHEPGEPVDIARCRWLTRGWCLQELIAPSLISFYDQHWTNFASSDDLLEQLVLHTGIDKGVLSDKLPMSTFPVAQRMSWAARRTTSRVEDEAYCLLGILGVNMPLLYGEGRNAFSRLQQEVLRTHDDPSIFLWSETKDEDGAEPALMLAPQIACFANSGGVIFASTLFARTTQPRFSLTSRGIRVRGATLRIGFSSNSSSELVYLLPLLELWATKMTGESVVEKGLPWLQFLKLSAGLYVRLPGWGMKPSETKLEVVGPEEDFHVANRADARASLLDMSHQTAFLQLRFEGSLANKVGLSVEPRDLWDSLRNGFYLDSHHGFTGYVKAHPIIQGPYGPSSTSFLIAFNWMPLGHSSNPGAASLLDAYLVPSHIWDLYANFSHSVEWRLELAIAHSNTSRIVTPCHEMSLSAESLQFTISASQMNLYGTPGLRRKQEDGFIRVSRSSSM